MGIWVTLNDAFTPSPCVLYSLEDTSPQAIGGILLFY